MDIDIEPEPSPAEREAIERALAARPVEPADPRGAWWREGVRENVSPEAEPA
jgi:hypothetical protein